MVTVFNKQFWEELIACFPFTVIPVSYISRKKTSVDMLNVIKTIWEAAVLILLMGVIYKVHS
jgi:hypothetical protein